MGGEGTEDNLPIGTKVYVRRTSVKRASKYGKCARSAGMGSQSGVNLSLRFLLCCGL